MIAQTRDSRVFSSTKSESDLIEKMNVSGFQWGRPTSLCQFVPTSRQVFVNLSGFISLTSSNDNIPEDLQQRTGK